MQLRNSNLKARKEHTCSYCGSKIIPGEMYNRSVNINDNYFYEWKSHLNCQKLAHLLYYKWAGEEGMSDDDFNEGVRDMYHNKINGKASNIREMVIELENTFKLTQ